VQIALRPAGKLPVKQVGLDLDLLACSQSVMKPMGESVPEVESISEGTEKPRPSASPVSDTRVDQSLNQNQQQPQGEDFSPSPASLPHPGRDGPVNSASPRPHSASPRTPKPTCQSAGCGGPLKGNKPDGVCWKCGHKPLPDAPLAPKKLVNEYGEEEEGLPHKFPSRDLEAVCSNPGCETTRMGSLYDSSQKYCDYASAANGATV
jgi:hypothetical protein